MSDPFRDDREAQLARADALSIENERLKAERDALKEKLAMQGASSASIVTVTSASTKPQITFHVHAHPRPLAPLVNPWENLARREEQRRLANRVVTLDGQVVKIGRVASAHLRLDYPSVARMHAVIEARTAAEAFIFDLGTASGTFVNGQRINKMSIKSGDVIKIGEVEMEITIMETR